MSFLPKMLALGLIASTLCACSAITVRPQGGLKNNSPANFNERQSYFLGGLIGENTVNLNKACPSGNVTQMQSVQTVADTLLGLITVGIYAPHTAKVWCGE